MRVGTTKDHGLYNKPSVAVHPGALAVGTLPQYNRIQGMWHILSKEQSTLCPISVVKDISGMLMFEMGGKNTSIAQQTVRRLHNYLYEVRKLFIRNHLKFWGKNAIKR